MKCRTCDKEQGYDFCSEECRVCARCGDKLSFEDDVLCILCSCGFQ